MFDTTPSPPKSYRKTPASRLIDRDRDTLVLLSAYKYGRADHIAAALGVKSIRPFSRRLRKLARAGYLTLPPQQSNFHNAHCRFSIYQLGDRGYDLLERAGLIRDPVAVYKRTKDEFAHSVMLCDVLLSIEIGAKAKGVDFIPYGMEVKIPSFISHVIRNKNTNREETHTSKDPLDPDALFTLRYPSGQTLHFALEVDCHNEPIERSNLQASSYLKKKLQYEAVFESGAYQAYAPHLWVLHVTTSRAHMRNIIDRLFTGPKPNLFKTYPALPRFNDFVPLDYEEPEPGGHVFSTPWLRANNEPFQM